jgi:hypothetical protein
VPRLAPCLVPERGAGHARVSALPWCVGTVECYLLASSVHSNLPLSISPSPLQRVALWAQGVSDDAEMCDTPGCSLAQRHAGGHSFLLVLSGKRERQHTAKSEQHRSANVTGATSTSSAAVQALGLLISHLESCGGAASMVEGWNVGVGPPRANGSRQDLTFFSPCGKSCRSKMEVARFLGLEVMVAARQNRTFASPSSAEAVQALGLLSSHLETCGGTASMVEGWSVGVGPPRAHGSRQDLTFSSPCGKTFRSKAEVARFLGLEVVPARKSRTFASSSSSAEAVQALRLLSSHLESCGGEASMVEGWNVGVGPPRPVIGQGRARARQDLTFFSPCGKAFRSKAEVARYLGLESGAPLQASSKRARRLKQPADHLRSQALWVDAVVVVEADGAGGDVDATVVDAALW